MRKAVHLCLSSHDEVMYRSEADLIMGFNCLALAMIESGARLLAETSPFCLEVVGSYHLQTALNYVLRQGLHHGLSTSPFGYPHCSANAFFRKELGKDYTPALLAPSAQYKYLPDGKKLPPGYRMSASGLSIREDVIDTAYVEKEYQSVRSYAAELFLRRFTNQAQVRRCLAL